MASMQLERSSLRDLGKSHALPLPPTHIIRTESEMQMEDDLHEAEWRDYCMFQRIMVGISNNQNKMYEALHHIQNDITCQDNAVRSVNAAIASNQRCLDHIALTRRRKSLTTNMKNEQSQGLYLKSTMVQEGIEDTSNDVLINTNQSMTPLSYVRKVSSDNSGSSSSDALNSEAINPELDFFLLDL